MCSPDEDALFTGILSPELTAKPFRKHMFSGGAHGWNIDIVTRIKPGIPVLLGIIYLVERMEQMPAESLVFCTLLGPEGPDRTGGRVARKRVSRAGANGPLDPFVTGHCFRHRGYRPYFENYTVDASILDIPSKAPQS
jgi:hypothetical protein